jgi:hypothetical protein
MSRAAGPNRWAIAGVLIGHFLLGFVWLVVYLGAVFLTSSETGWVDLVLLLGGFCWLGAAALIVMGWQSGSYWYWGIPVAWATVFVIAAVVVVEAATNSFELRPVGATATLAESADCLVRYEHNFKGWSLDKDNVDFCFPTQTGAKKKALIGCFNKYERNHPDHKGWPENNMQGCMWDGLTATTAPRVVRLVFGKAVAEPAVPHAGKDFVLTVGVTRSDSGAKIARPEIETEPKLDVAVTIDGPSNNGLSYMTYFEDGRIHVLFTTPKAAKGRRLTIKMTIAADSPTATKIVTFPVAP